MVEGIERSHELRQCDVDGVPTYYVDTHQTPAACLTFRAGVVDEVLTKHGWLHLFEHMAMHGRLSSRVRANASVGIWATDFQVTGEQDDVVAFVNGLCRWLAAPELDPMDHERKILEAESAQRPPNDLAQQLDARYGALGVGLTNYEELGLRTAEPTAVGDFSRPFFVRQNVTLALNCPPPAGLELALPAGCRSPIPNAPEMLTASLPAYTPGRQGAVVTSGLLRNSPLSSVVGELVAGAVNDKLRHEMGSSYGTTALVERLDSDKLFLCLVSDLLPDWNRDGARLVYEAIRGLRDDLPPDELWVARDHRLRALRDEPTGLWQAAESARAVLRGGSAYTREDIEEELVALDSSDVERELDLFASTLLLSSPAGEDSTVDLPFHSGLPEAAAETGDPGVTFRPWTAPMDRSVLTITPRLCEVTSPGVRHARRLDEVVALLKYPDGARTLISPEGVALHIEPHVWRHGASAIERLDSTISARLHVQMDERPGSAIPPRPSKRLRFLAPLRHLMASPIVEIPVIALVVVVMLWGLASSDAAMRGPGVPGFWLALALLVWWSRVRRQRPKRRQ